MMITNATTIIIMNILQQRWCWAKLNEVINLENAEYEDIYEDVVIKNNDVPIIITGVLVRKHISTGRNIYINHPDSIHKIENRLKAATEML